MLSTFSCGEFVKHLFSPLNIIVQMQTYTVGKQPMWIAYWMKMWPLSKERLHSGSENTGWLTFNTTVHHAPCASRFTSTTFSSWTCFLTPSPCRLSLSLTGAASSSNQGSASSCSMFPVPAALPSTWEHQHPSEEWLICLVLTYVQGCVSFFLMTKKTWIILIWIVGMGNKPALWNLDIEKHLLLGVKERG